MIGLGLPEILLLLVVLSVPVVVVMACVLVIRALTRPRDLAPGALGAFPGGGSEEVRLAVARESQLVRLTRVGGLVVGLLVAVIVSSTVPWGGGGMLAPAVVGLFVLVGTALGEARVRRVRSGPRTASLTPRRLRDYLPVTLTAVVLTTLVATLATLVLTTLTASRDGGTGHARALVCSGPGGASTVTPYPGSWYSVPLALALALVVVVAVGTARLVVRRPRGALGQEAGDDALRRRSVHVVVAAAGLAVAAPLTGIASVAGYALNTVGTMSGASTIVFRDGTRFTEPATTCPGWMAPTGTGLDLVAIAAFVVAVWCGLLLLSTAPVRGRAVVAEPVGRR